MGSFGPTGLDSDTDVGNPRMLRWFLTRVASSHELWPIHVRSKINYEAF